MSKVQKLEDQLSIEVKLHEFVCEFIIDADENINLTAGRNVNIKAGSRVVTQSNQADCVAKTGNLAPKGTSTGESIFPAGSPAGDDEVEETFNAGGTNKYGAIG